MQLEGQVGVARSFLSGRELPDSQSSRASPDLLVRFASFLDLLLPKLTLIVELLLAKTPVVNVYNSSSNVDNIPRADKECQTGPELSTPRAPEDPFTMEEGSTANITSPNIIEDEVLEAVLECTICKETFNSNTQLDCHIKKSCDFCDQSFSTKAQE